MQHILIKDLCAGEEIHATFLLTAASQQQAKNGPYWNLTLSDASGNINAKIWAPLSTHFTELPVASFVKIEGRTDSYRDQVQLNITALRMLSDAEAVDLDMALYVPSSPYNIDDMWQELEDLCHKEFTHKAWHDFIFSVLNNNDVRLGWMGCPAAKNVHHAYRGGLLEHSLSVAKLTLSIASHYPKLDRQVLLAGALFHDMGKIWEYSFGLVTDYTDVGRLLGHMQLALEFLQPFLEKSQLEDAYVQHFKHLILSHHGSYEFGSARVPQTPEAMLLHYADNIDAKMAQCNQIFATQEDDFVGWSPYQRTLDRYMYQPQRLPNILNTDEPNNCTLEDTAKVQAIQTEDVPVEVTFEEKKPTETAPIEIVYTETTPPPLQQSEAINNETVNDSNIVDSEANKEDTQEKAQGIQCSLL